MPPDRPPVELLDTDVVLCRRILDLRVALDHVTRELESCRHLLIEIDALDQEHELAGEIRERINAADAALKIAKEVNHV